MTTQGKDDAWENGGKPELKICRPPLFGGDCGDLPEPLWWWFQTQTRWRPQSDLGCQWAHTCTGERRSQDECVGWLLPVLTQLLNTFEMMMMRRINQDDRPCPVPRRTPEQKWSPIRSERFPVFWVGTPDVYEWIVWAALLQILKGQNCRMLEDEWFSLDATKRVETSWSNAPDDWLICQQQHAMSGWSTGCLCSDRHLTSTSRFQKVLTQSQLNDWKCQLLRLK